MPARGLDATRRIVSENQARLGMVSRYDSV